MKKKLHLNGVKVYFLWIITNGESHCSVLPTRPSLGGYNCWWGDPCERIFEVTSVVSAPTTGLWGRCGRVRWRAQFKNLNVKLKFYKSLQINFPFFSIMHMKWCFGLGMGIWGVAKRRGISVGLPIGWVENSIWMEWKCISTILPMGSPTVVSSRPAPLLEVAIVGLVILVNES